MRLRFDNCTPGTIARRVAALTLAALFSLGSACTVMPQSRVALGSLPSNVSLHRVTPALLQQLSAETMSRKFGCRVGFCPDSWDYRVGPGDVLSILVWDHPQMNMPAGPNRSPAEVGNRIHGDGTIFYPHIGTAMVSGKTVSQIRELITMGLKKVIPKPQVDVSIASFRENNHVYVLGEVPKPGKLPLKMSRLSLTDALAQSGGVDEPTANARGIFVFRSKDSGDGTDVFQLDAQSPTAFLWGTQFNLQAQDVVYVTAAPATRWNRIISKLIPSLSAFNTLLLLEDRM